MTVSELIKELQKYNGEVEVVTRDWSSGDSFNGPTVIYWAVEAVEEVDDETKVVIVD